MTETSKAHDRRTREGWFEKYIQEPGIDIGCGRELVWPTFRGWDLIFGDGDAQKMEGVEDESYLTVYASHLLEHLNDPIEALVNWFRILKPNGHLVVIVPHRDLYEGRTRLPSHNPEHKTFWLPEYNEEPDTLGLLQTVKLALPIGQWELCDLRTCDDGEYGIECIVKKK